MSVSYWDGTNFTLRFARATGNFLDAGPPVVTSAPGLQLWPNPARVASRVSFSSRGRPVRSYEVFDLAGRRTAQIAADPRGGAEWDTRSEAGEFASTGLYFARARYPDGTVGERQRLVLVR